jgi:ABC-type Fe3+-siderophore transport system permease subunit
LLSANLVLTFVVLANWVDWYGGWVWGPRPLIAGIIPAAAAIPRWIDHRRRRRVWVLLLFLAGFLVSAPTLVVSQRAQLANRPGPFGPSIVRQIRLIPETFRTTTDEIRAGSVAHRYEEHVNVWQVGVIQRLGWRGVWLAAIVSTALLAIAAMCIRTLHKTIQRLS